MFDKAMTQDELARMYHANVIDETGEKVGGVGQIYLDDQSERPTWATVKTGLFGTRETFVPLAGASTQGDDLRVPYTKDFIKDAPSVDADGHISPEEEAELYRYYRLDGAGHGVDERHGVAGTGVATDHVADRDRVGIDHDVNRADADRARTDRVEGDSVVRREEELHVGKERVATGQVRLRKHVVTEQKTITVPVEREEYVVEREPIREGDHGGRIGDDDGAVVTLHEERPVVEKETVAKERVGLGKEVHTEDRQVTETVAKEQVEVERDGHANVERDARVGEGREGLKDKLDRDNDGRLDADDLKPRP